MDAAAELGRDPVSKHQIQPEYGDEQADAGPQARTGTGEYHFPCSADHEQDWQPYPVDPYSAIICDDRTYIYIHTIGREASRRSYFVCSSCVPLNRNTK